MNLPFKNIFPTAKSEKPIEPVVLHYEFLPVPVHLYIERRRNSRISLLKANANVRLPANLPKLKRQAELDKLLNWAVTHIEKKGLYPESHLARNYMEEGEIQISGELWKLEFSEENNTNKIRLNTDYSTKVITFRGNFSEWDKSALLPAIKALLIKTFRLHYKEFILNLVSSINDTTLNKSYGNVRLKYMKSRWGSCSSKKNINLSLRLLLLPEEVRNYVILHELAHLVEMNHSRAFWDLVGKYDPDYKSHEAWLRKNGHLYDF